MADTVASNEMQSCRSLNVTVVSDSVHTYLSYSRKMQVRLAEINNNVSNVIKESCSGIDDICNRVRQCLSEMEQSPKTCLTSEMMDCEILDDETKSIEDTLHDINETVEDVSIIEEKSEVQPPESPLIFEELYYGNQEDPDNMELSLKLEKIEQSLEGSPPQHETKRDNGDANNEGFSCQKQASDKRIYSLLDRNRSLSEFACDSESTISLDKFKQKISSLCDNFDMMNKLVEDINKKITKFSETAIPNEKEIKKKCETAKLNKSLSESKATKDLTKCNNEQKHIELDYCFSETDRGLFEMDKWDSNLQIIPDVYRKRASTDLYKKLVAQVQANDSLILFQNLMKKQKSLGKDNQADTSQMELKIPLLSYSFPEKSATNIPSQDQPSKKINLAKKYADSLWFSPRRVVKQKSPPGSHSKHRKVKNKSRESPVKRITLECSKNSSNKTKQLPKLESVQHVGKRTCSLECTCRLIVQNDRPTSASTKCHLQWLKAKPAQRKLEFLDILDDLTYRDLLPLQSEYPRRDNQQATELDYKNIQETYLYKLIYGKQYGRNAWKQLLQPSLASSKNYNSPKIPCRTTLKTTVEKKLIKNILQEKFETQGYSRTEILKKLLPYIYDSKNKEDNYGQSVVVMPVRVYYDNSKTSEPPTKLNNPARPYQGVSRRAPLSPSRETKFLKKWEWSGPKPPKPMKVVYDSLPRKPIIPSISTLIKASALPSKPLISSARLSGEKNPTKRVTSRSFSPKGFASYCQDIRTSKKDLLEPRQQQHIAIYSKIQTDIQKLKNEIYGRTNNQADKKLWSQKYGKSDGQKLVSYIQQRESMTESRLPAYAMPKNRIPANVPERNLSFLREISPHRQVLHHIQNLKLKNEEIQSNIKKAIDVIETRMMDILCDDSKSAEAFNIMEKEITNVLSLMKCTANTNLKSISSKLSVSKDETSSNSEKDMSLTENYNIISDHLFERLERILDTGGSSFSSTSTVQSGRIKQWRGKDKTLTRKWKISGSRRNKIDIVCTSTSASMDEQIMVRHSSTVGSRKTEKSEAKYKLSASTPFIIDLISTKHWENTCGDQNVPPDEDVDAGNDRKIAEEDNVVLETHEDQVWLNSEGDFLKSDDASQKTNIEPKHIISDHKVEKPITEKEPQISTEISNPEKKIDTCSKSIMDSDIEEFIKNELDIVIDSITILEKQTNPARLQNQPIPSADNLEKENLGSSNYDNPRSNPSHVDKKMQVAIPKLKSVEETNVGQTQSESMANGDGVENEMLQSNDNIRRADTDEVTADKVNDLIPIQGKETNQSQLQHKEETEKEESELSNSKGRRCDHFNANKNTQVRYKVIDTKEATDKTPNLAQTQNESPKIEKEEPRSASCNIQQSDSDEQMQVIKTEGSKYTEHVEKILKRVENVYYQLEEIQESESLDKIPVFKETEVSEIHSDIFLTPFMQAVKETRKNVKECNKMALIKKSPSYYNVMTFLDALTSLQKETPYEIYFAHLQHYPQVYQQATIYRHTETWHEARYSSSTSLRSSCLRKSSDDSRSKQLKKVSFVQIGKEDKSNQVTLCPFHKIKAVRISSQQFPPLESSDEEGGGKKSASDRGDCVRETKGKMDRMDCGIGSKRVSAGESTNNSDTSHKCSSVKSACSARKHRDLEIDRKLKHTCKLHGQLGKTSEILKPEVRKCSKIEGGCKKVKNLEMSVRYVKSTQVFSQMQTEKKPEETSITQSPTEDTDNQTSNDEPSIDYPECIEENPDDSKSTEKDFLDDSLMDPFYDYASDNVTPKGVIQKIEEDKAKHAKNPETQPKVVVFREVVEVPNPVPLPKAIHNVNDIEEYKKRLEKRKEIRLMRKTSAEIVRRKISRIHSDNENVVLLKSFYAIIYILMFAALSLDYRCL